MPCSSTKGRKKKQGLKYDQSLPKNLHLKSLLLRNLPVSVFPFRIQPWQPHRCMSGGPPGLHPAGTCNYSFFLSPPKKKPRNTLNNQGFCWCLEINWTKKNKSLHGKWLVKSPFPSTSNGLFWGSRKTWKAVCSPKWRLDSLYMKKKTCGSQFLSEIWAYQKKNV